MKQEERDLLERRTLDRREISKVRIDGFDNGSKWLIRSLMALVVAVPASAFYVGSALDDIPENTKHIELLAENQSEVLQALSRIGVQIDNNIEDIDDNTNEIKRLRDNDALERIR